ncbi:fimbria/pilus outer membrane usher protein, partial [Escherichia coli]|nr:fimbria/pilus outer membrane usher protein [Escherichia coli]
YTNYSVSVSKNFDIGDFKGISASLAVSRIRWDDDEENQYYFSFSLPLQQNRNISYSMQRTGSSNTSQMISWYDSSDRNNIWNISASA